MSVTPEDFYEVMATMRRDGASLESAVRALVDRGAKDIDLVRVVKRVEGVGNGRATELINATGVTRPQQIGITVVFPDGYSVDEYLALQNEEAGPESADE